MGPIIMLQTQMGSPDGIAVHRFVEGQVYDLSPMLSEELRAIFLKEGWAKEQSLEVPAALCPEPVAEKTVEKASRKKGGV